MLIFVLGVPIIIAILYTYLFIFPIQYTEDFDWLGGLLCTPIAVGITVFIILKVTKNFKQQVSRTLKSIILSMVLTVTLFIYPPAHNVHHYYKNLYLTRLMYNQSETFFNQQSIKRSAEVVDKMQNNLPNKWKIVEMEYNAQTDLYWFSALEPSFLFGSTRHIGVYGTANGNLEIISLNDVWNQVKAEKSVPDVEQFTAQSGVRTIEFMTNYGHHYYVTLTVYNNKIQPNITLSPPTPQGK